MAELLIKGIEINNPVPELNRGCYKVGMIVGIYPDGFVYGTGETHPNFYKVKIPLIPIDHPILLKLQKIRQIIDESNGVSPEIIIQKRRKAWLLYNDIPVGAKLKLKNEGELIIKAHPDYNGTYDYTWSQIKNYFWDDDMQSVFTENLI